MKIIIFRTDSGSAIGIGHLIRCLVLANAFKKKGYLTVFICRPHHGSSHHLIEENGHKLHLLSPPRFQAEPDNGDKGAYSLWLGCAELEDAAETYAIVQHYSDSNIALCIDHYTVTNTWNKILRPLIDKIIVIDDLANRPLDCDIIINQAPGCAEDSYTNLVPEGCNILTGEKYALLNPCFLEYRHQALSRRLTFATNKKRALVSFGGGDPDNLSQSACSAMTQLGYSVSIIATSSFPHLEKLQQLIANNLNIQLYINIDQSQVAQLISEADIGIGAAGGGALERCCLGLPTITLLTASNQEKQFQALSDSKAIIPFKKDKLAPESIENMLSDHSLDQVAGKAAELIDGEGYLRVVRAISDE